MKLVQNLFIRYILVFGFLIIAAIFTSGCSSNRTTRYTYKPEQAFSADYYSSLSQKLKDGDINTIKLHDKSGNVYILDAWKIDSSKKVIIGRGVKLDYNRAPIDSGKLKIPITDVSLVETNVSNTNFNVVFLAGLSVVTTALGVFCILNPKACFGSCPTFYASDGTNMILQAEGFSSSIAPNLEARDIDALYHAKPKNRIFDVDVTNEALETHIIRYANILAVPKPLGGRIFHTNENEFYGLTNLSVPVSVRDPIGETTRLFSEFDGKERYSFADSIDLTTKETIELTFKNNEPGKKGFVLGFRQTLMTTFLFYQTLAYMGTRYGDWFSNMSNGIKTFPGFILNADNLFGSIEPSYQNDSGEWVALDKLYENGPIATDVHLIKIPEEIIRPVIRIKLKMTKGYWRIDYAAIGNLEGKASPVVLKPVDIINNGRSDSNAHACLIDSMSQLITYPGDRYKLIYNLPEDFSNYELFLDSRGYYLEWMRREWLAEENPIKINELSLNINKCVSESRFESSLCCVGSRSLALY